MRNIQNTAVSMLANWILDLAFVQALAACTRRFTRTAHPFFVRTVSGITTGFVLMVSSIAPLSANDLPNPDTLKVCADPYLLPFSNKNEEGFENKIAELFAKKLNADLEYEWFPQRIGFIRNTLRSEIGTSGKYKCDLVMSAPVNFELAATTDPYYTSTYVLVYIKGRGLDELTDPAMLEKMAKEGKDIRFGVVDKGPGQLWVAYNGLMGNIVPYQGMGGDPEVSPGQLLINELAADNINAAIVWGPTAGYYAKKLKEEKGLEMILLPVEGDRRDRNMQFVYSMSMAVRYGEEEWKNRINQLIHEYKDEIHAILSDYGVPLLETPKEHLVREDDDD